MGSYRSITSAWESSTNMIFWGIIIVSFSGLFNIIGDYISLVATMMELIGTIAYYIPGFSSICNQNWVKDLMAVTLLIKGMVLVGYFLYLWGLTSFVKVQKLSTTSTWVRDVRGAVVMLIIAYVFDYALSKMALIPGLNLVFKLAMWVCFMIVFYSLKNAFDGLMHASDWSARSQRGARNLRYAAACEIRLRWLPLITFGILLIVGFVGVGYISNANNYERMVSHTAFFSGLMGLILLICGIITLCAAFCAFWWPILGWYRIKTGGYALVSDAVGNKPIKESQPEKEVVMDASHYTPPVAETEGSSSLPESHLTYTSNPIREKVAEQQDTSASKPISATLSIQDTNQKSVPIRKSFDKKKLKYVWAGVAVAIIIVGGWLVFHNSGSSASGIFAGKQLEEVFPKVHDVVEVDAEAANLRIGPGADYANAIIRDQHSGNRYIMQTWQGQRLLIDGEEGDWYRLAVKDADGSPVYIKQSLCKDINKGMIENETVYTDWFDQDFECGGGITVTHRSKENRLVVMHKHHYCDSDDLLVGTYQQGMYVFYYSTFLMNKICDGDGEEFSYNQESHDLHYGKRLTRKASYNSDDELEIDWDKVSEDQLAEIFGEAINNKSINVEIVTANDIEEAKKHENDEGGGYDEEEVTEIRYELGEDAKTQMPILYAIVNGERIETKIAEDMPIINILDQNDYDGDGLQEALVSDHDGGNHNGESPYIVYYNSQNQTFKAAGGFLDRLYNEFDLKPEPWKDKISLTEKVGVRRDRYVFENHKIKLVESKLPNLGQKVSTISIDITDKMEPDDESLYLIKVDVNGDGVSDNATFYRSAFGTAFYGEYMELVKIVTDRWQIGDSENHLGIWCKSCTFLKSQSNGIPDILCDNARLYKWDGNQYKEKQ